MPFVVFGAVATRDRRRAATIRLVPPNENVLGLQVGVDNVDGSQLLQCVGDMPRPVAQDVLIDGVPLADEVPHITVRGCTRR